jgi:hypothetical protein
VHDERAPSLRRKLYLGKERGPLQLSRRIVVMVVEPALPNGNCAIADLLGYERNVACRIEALSIVWVDTGAVEHKARMIARDQGRFRGGVRRLADADNRPRSCGAGPLDYLAAVAVEGRVREVGVAVDED